MSLIEFINIKIHLQKIGFITFIMFITASLIYYNHFIALSVLFDVLIWLKSKHSLLQNLLKSRFGLFVNFFHSFLIWVVPTFEAFISKETGRRIFIWVGERSSDSEANSRAEPARSEFFYYRSVPKKSFCHRNQYDKYNFSLLVIIK